MAVILIWEGDHPYCRVCKKEMGYWVPGLSRDEHAHPECEGRELAEKLVEMIRTEERING